MNKGTDKPTYEKDRCGDIERWDERDILFSRSDLFRYFGVESSEFRRYYEGNRDDLEYDTRINRELNLGGTGGVDRPMFETQFKMIERIASEAFVDGEPAPDRKEIPPERASLKVKELARILGADLAGTGPLRQEWVYTHKGRSFGDRDGFLPYGSPIDLGHHKHAVALGFRMNHSLIQSAPDFPVLLATAREYAFGAWVSIQLAEYIRMLGYSARAHHLYNYQVIAVPVAVDCGLGELSRAGFLLTKEFGLGLRVAVVTTDMPLEQDRPVDIGVQSFCESCKVCAENCPSGAIPSGGKVEWNGIQKWKLDEKKCYRYWRTASTDCGICMASCPWTKPDTRFHRMMSRIASRSGPHQSWMVTADRLFYGRFRGRPRPDFLEPRAAAEGD